MPAVAGEAKRRGSMGPRWARDSTDGQQAVTDGLIKTDVNLAARRDLTPVRRPRVYTDALRCQRQRRGSRREGLDHERLGGARVHPHELTLDGDCHHNVAYAVAQRAPKTRGRCRVSTDTPAESPTLGLGKRSTPPGSPKTKEEVQASAQHHDLSTPKLRQGDPAFDFTLPTLDATHGLSDGTVQLSAFRNERPVALIFGSYT